MNQPNCANREERMRVHIGDQLTIIIPALLTNEDHQAVESLIRDTIEDLQEVGLTNLEEYYREQTQRFINTRNWSS